MSGSKNHYSNRRAFIRDASTVAATATFVSSIMPVYPSAVEAQEQRDNWFKNIYRLLHLDAHFGGYKEIYKNFDAEATAQIFQEIGVQMVSYMAHDGPSYYPTKIGKMHPGLARDFVGEFTRALKKRGIKTIVYYGMGSCQNTSKVDEIIIPQMKEIIELYDVDGFFPDGHLQPYLMSTCHCESCQKQFAEEVGGEIPKDDSDPRAFAYRKWSNKQMESFIEKVYRALSAIKPDIAFLNNHLWVSRYPITPPRYVKHICWDTPVPDVGLYSWNFSFEARYLSTLTDILPDITWSLMNVSSKTWGDFALRETEAFMQECAIMLAGCGRTYLSYNPYPSGNPAPALMEAFEKVNRRTIELEPFVKGCKPVKDVAVLHSADSVWSKAPMIPHTTWEPSPAYHSVAGAHKALIEGHVQMSMLNSDVFIKTIHEYSALILADQRILSKQECRVIREFVRNGGSLIATFETGTRDMENNHLDNFSIDDVLGIRYRETVDTSVSYLRVKSKVEQHGIPAYDIPVAGKYVRVETTTAKTLVELVPPYGRAPGEFSEGPGITVNSFGKGKALYCASGLFAGYYKEDTPLLRKLALWMLDIVYPVASRTIALDNTPINVEVFYNQKGKERFVHLVNYSGDKREIGPAMAQDFPLVHGIRVRVRLSSKPSRITAVPDDKTISFEYNDRWASFDGKPLAIHDVYRIEA